MVQKDDGGKDLFSLSTWLNAKTFPKLCETNLSSSSLFLSKWTSENVFSNQEVKALINIWSVHSCHRKFLTCFS